MKAGLAHLAVAAAAVAAALPAIASAATSPVLKVAVPSPGAISFSVFKEQGTLRPGATLPRRSGFTGQVVISNASQLPRGLAVYGAERVVTSGRQVALTLGIVVLRPASARTTSSVAAGSPPVSKQGQDNVAIAIAAFVKGRLDILNGSDEAQDPNLALTLDTRGKVKVSESHPLLEDYIADFGSPDRGPLDVFEEVAPLGGSWDDGHDFGWRLKGSPRGSAAAAPVLQDLDFLLREIETQLESSPTGEVDSRVVSIMELLEAAVGFPKGSLTPASRPGSTTTPTPITTTSTSVVVTDTKATFGGVVCSPGGGTLKLDWVIKGAPAGAKVVVELTGPGLPAQVTLTVGANGAVSDELPITGSGDWTDTVVSVNGKPVQGAATSHADATCG